jgi:hypothetical protein
VDKRKIKVSATWWGEAAAEQPAITHHEVDLEIGYEDETLYIDGLKPGQGLALELADIARAIASCPE